MLVDQEFSEDTNKKSEVMNVLKLRILRAGSLQNERIKGGSKCAEKGTMAQIVIPDVSSDQRCQALEIKQGSRTSDNSRNIPAAERQRSSS